MGAYEKRLAEAQKEWPRLKVVRKADSPLMRGIAWVLKNVLRTGDDFMSRFVSTVGFTIYTHSKWDTSSPDSKLIILEHELVHVRQFATFLLPRKFWSVNVVLFAFAYLFCLPAFWSYRAVAEREAYAHQLWVESQIGFFQPRNLAHVDFYLEWLGGLFTGPSYFYMWRKEPCERYFRDVIERIKNGERF